MKKVQSNLVHIIGNFLHISSSSVHPACKSFLQFCKILQPQMRIKRGHTHVDLSFTGTNVALSKRSTSRKERDNEDRSTAHCFDGGFYPIYSFSRVMWKRQQPERCNGPGRRDFSTGRFFQRLRLDSLNRHPRRAACGDDGGRSRCCRRRTATHLDADGRHRKRSRASSCTCADA